MSCSHEFSDISQVLRQELESANRDLAQVRDLVADAMKQLALGFEAIAVDSRAQHQTLMRALAEVDSASKTSGSIANYVAQSEQLVQRIAGGLEQASVRTQELTHRLTAIDTVFGRLDVLSGSVRDISTEIQVLSFNASLEAARAGDAGRGFGVVARSVQSLAKDFRALSEKICVTVEEARADLGSATQAAQTAVDADRQLCSRTQSEMDALHRNTTTLNGELGEALRDAKQLSEGVQSGVNRCIRGLQFDDLVGQICKAAQARLEAVGSLVEAPTSLAVESADTPGNAQALERTLAHLDTTRHRAVLQCSLDAGDVEFF